jgi:hypothetical protein
LRQQLYLCTQITFFNALDLGVANFMCIAAIARKVGLAVLKQPNPIPGFVSRLMNR